MVWAVWAGPARAAETCSEERPQVGILQLDGRGSVTAYRGGSDVELRNGAPVCAEDLLPAGPLNGRIDRPFGDDLPIVARKETRVPGRRHWIWQWLGSVLGRNHLFRRPVHAGSPLGGDRPGFALVGVDRETARIGLNHRELIVPVNPMPTAFRVELYAPGSREGTVATVQPGSTQARFTRLKARRGLWKLVIDPGRIVGGFEMVEHPWDESLLRALQPPLTPREQALAHACLDPVRNGLEAYLRLAQMQGPGGEDLALPLDWQRPKRMLDCATPAD